MVARRFTPATRRTVDGVFNSVVRYLGTLEDGSKELGVFAYLEDLERVLAFARWHFRPRLDGQPRSTSGLAGFFHTMRSCWLASGATALEASDRLRALKRALRGGADRGRYILLTLRSADPAPAPSDPQVARARAWYAQTIARLRSEGQASHKHVQRVVQERNLMETPLRTAMRWTTLASCRADKIVYDAANENVYVDEVVVKANRNRQRILVPEKQVGTVTISRWYLDPALLELYEEELQLDGFSLFEYIRSGDRAALPWIVARDDTFGPHMRGKLVSPLWRGGKHGYLSRSALGDVLERITHERLGLQSGRGHPLRRKAAIDYAPLAVRFPQAVEAIIRMGPAMWNRYRVSVDRNPALLFAGQRSVLDILSGRADSDDVSTSGDMPAPASVTGPAAPPPVAKRRRIRARIAPEDLLGA